MEESIFTKIIKREIPAEIVYEDDDFIAILDINPINPGHTLLITKNPSVNLYDMRKEDLEKLGPLLRKLGGIIKKGVGAEGLNIAMNNGEAALVDHTHIHLIPRFKNDGLKDWPGKPYKDGEMSKIAEKIRKTI